MTSSCTVVPATSERWADLEALFGPNGAYSGCWCMFLRVPTAVFERNCPGGGPANRALLKQLVTRGEVPGLLAYRRSQPVGWVAVAPREAFTRVLRSPVHKPVDDVEGVYSITCFFVDKSARGSGVADALLAAAVDHARQCGARYVEAYPNDVEGSCDAASMWRGSLTQFRRAGFEVIARRKPARPIVRRSLVGAPRRRRA